MLNSLGNLPAAFCLKCESSACCQHFFFFVHHISWSPVCAQLQAYWQGCSIDDFLVFPFCLWLWSRQGAQVSWRVSLTLTSFFDHLSGREDDHETTRQLSSDFIAVLPSPCFFQQTWRVYCQKADVIGWLALNDRVAACSPTI